MLILEGAVAENAQAHDVERVLKTLLRELGASRAAKVAAEITGVSRKELYALAVKLGGHGAAAPSEE